MGFRRCLSFVSGIIGSICISTSVGWGQDGGQIDIRFPVVRDGEATVNVVVAGDHKALKAAVEDLKTYVQRMTGAELKCTSGKSDLPGPTLHLGETDLYAKTERSRGAVRQDGFLVARFGEDLLVSGTMPQGTANGITTILQDQFGVRWYYAGSLWEIVPEKRSLSIELTSNTESGAYVENPSFYGRGVWGRPSSAALGRRMRFTEPDVPLPYVGTGHHLSSVVNPEKYGDHPDYFAFFDGKRHVESGVHPCFSHPDMFDIFMDAVRKGVTSFGVNDNMTACKCERCLAIDGRSEPYMGMWNCSETYFQLMSRVASQTAIEFPGRQLGVFAYQLTNAPPQTVEHIGDNVSVVLCQDTAQYFDPDYKRTDQDMSAEWVRKVGHVRFYDYIGINYWTPRYFPHILADQIKHIARVGVEGYGTHSTSMIDSSMPMYYLLYQLMWNADIDPDQLIDTMIDDLYGAAAEPVGQFYAHWEQCWQRQTKGRWFWGMDNFRGEMQIYRWDDFERGRTLLEEAAALAKEDLVRQRVQFLRDRYAFTYASARAHMISMKAIRWKPSDHFADAIRLSNQVADTWRDWADQLKTTCELSGTPVSGWISKTGRVRVWGLRQQMRDAAMAPLVRWVRAHEGTLDPARLRFVERMCAGTGLINRETIESHAPDNAGFTPRKPRVDALLVADVDRCEAPMPINAAADEWPDLGRISAAPWVFRLRPTDQETGKYDEPIAENVMDPPASEDQSMSWQAGWDEHSLYLRIVVRDSNHKQGQPAPAMWKEDSVQIAFNPHREVFEYDLASWDYIWGGYRKDEAEFGVSFRDGNTDVCVWRAPSLPEGVEANSLIRAKAGRYGQHTVYEIAVDWALMPGFEPKPENSIGICLVVNDLDDGVRRSAEYGAGVAHAKRPSEFAAIRLIDR